MEEFPCTICKTACTPYSPIHIDERNQPVEPLVIHEEKFCKECLIKNHLENKGCPVCNANYIKPFDFSEEEKAAKENAQKISNMFSEVPNEVPKEKPVEKPTPIDISDDEVDSDYEPEDVERKKRKRKAPRNREAVREDNIADPAPLPTPVDVPNPPRGTTSANRKQATLTKIQKLAQDTPIPETHCAYKFGKTSEKHPHGLCLEVDNLIIGKDKLLYCWEHEISGPLKNKAMDTDKRVNAREKSVNEAVKISEDRHQKNAVRRALERRLNKKEKYVDDLEEDDKMMEDFSKMISEYRNMEVDKQSQQPENSSTYGLPSVPFVSRLFSYVTGQKPKQ